MVGASCHEWVAEVNVVAVGHLRGGHPFYVFPRCVVVAVSVAVFDVVARRACEVVPIEFVAACFVVVELNVDWSQVGCWRRGRGDDGHWSVFADPAGQASVVAVAVGVLVGIGPGLGVDVGVGVFTGFAPPVIVINASGFSKSDQGSCSRTLEWARTA